MIQRGGLRSQTNHAIALFQLEIPKYLLISICRITILALTAEWIKPMTSLRRTLVPLYLVYPYYDTYPSPEDILKKKV